jgi:hypothetical protein
MENNDLLKEQAKRLRQIASNTEEPQDVSRTYTLTGSLVALSTECSRFVTLMNTTGSNLSFTVNNTTSGISGATILLPTNAGISIDTPNASNIKVSGSGTLYYLVSQ